MSLPKGAKEELGIAGDEGMGPLTVDPAPKEEDSDNEEAIAARANKAYEKEMTHRIFNEGRYGLGVNASSFGVRRYFMDENALAFNVDISGAPGTQWGEPRVGPIRPRLEWKIEKLD